MNKIAVIGLVGESVFLRVEKFHTGGETLEASEIHTEPGGKSWKEAAANRKKKMSEIMLGKDGIWLDYDTKNKKTSDCISCASFLPYWLGLSEDKSSLKKLFSLLNCEYGISAAVPHKYAYQWGYPNGWAPLHYGAFCALKKVGLEEEAKDTAQKFCALAENNFERTGRLWEKYNVVSGSTDTVDEYKMPPMFGWTAGVYCALKESLCR